MENTITLGHAVEKQGRLVRELQRLLEIEHLRLLAIEDIARRELFLRRSVEKVHEHLSEERL